MASDGGETEVLYSWLIVATARNGELVYEAGWRHRQEDGSLKTMKRRLGPAWLERGEDGEYLKRRGRPKPGFLHEAAAIVAKDRVIRDVEREFAEAADIATAAARVTASFREVAHAYLHWLEHVQDAKPSTLQEHRYALAEPGTPHRRGKGTHSGYIMDAFGDRPADEIATRDVNELLNKIAATEVAPRTVNKHRQLISAIYGYGCKEATFNLPRNPATDSDRRQEPERATLDFYSPEEIEALARSLEVGAHRDPDAPAVNDDEKLAQQAEDRQDAELVRVAAYAGLRRGELVALRWRHVDFEKHKIVVQRAVSANVDATSTKSRKAREVPLPDQAAGALARLSQRGDFMQPNDYVFVNRLGRRLDASALRRRVSRAREAAELRELRFHDLRHTYGSLLVAGGIDLASVKAAMGHARLSTTERYLHARSATDLADKFTQAFAGTSPDDARAPQADQPGR
ncbi:site-specific integrase [Paraconexibacter antarcticus]|uniref:Site-specific integrase n=1 Tax=Paraconexibacter antarcticus TaxID=2949664 RepID=A0ABY5DSB6_9ACTN|nr:site-specific integrase [Paraconexibacter antarcticus]UTI64345.1 site-specific integrase [Paraconexibacter antarcticus]